MASRTGPIVIIEDDIDDRDLMREVFADLKAPNALKFFPTCHEAYTYLQSTTDKPFLIISDINLPGMSGAELKRKINEDPRLRRTSIPYIFLTTTSAHEAILEAYESLAQGFFVKPNDIKSLRQTIDMILKYWKICRHPDPTQV